MPVDFKTLKRPKAQVSKHEFTDPANPGVVVTMWLGPIDPLELSAADEYGAELTRMYVTGGWVDDDLKYQKDPLPLHAIDGEPISLSRNACLTAARIERMQRAKADHADDFYPATALFEMAVTMPDAWYELQDIAGGYLGGEGWLGKGSKADSGTQSGPA